jgi:hypothetical protein
MTSEAFVQLIGNFIEESPRLQYLLQLLVYIAEQQQVLRDRLGSLANATYNTAGVQTSQHDLTRELGEIGEFIRTTYNTRSIWSGIEDLGTRAIAVKQTTVGQEVGEEVSNRLSRFSEAYEQFVKTYSVGSTLTLLQVGNDLYTSFDSLRQTAILTKNAMSHDLTLHETETTLKLAFSSTPTLLELAEKLSALADIYEKLCQLFDISTARQPLRIAKIETGSWFLKVAGAIPILAILSRLMEDAIRYCYRNYTREGKLSMLPRKAEAAEAILELKAKLNEAGIGSPEIDANLQAAVVTLAQDLNTLLNGELRIVVNDIELLVPDEGAVRELPTRPPLILDSPVQDLESENASDENDENDSGHK